MGDHVRIDFDADAFQEVREPDALDHLAAALVLQSVLRPEVDHGGGEVAQPVVVLVGVHLHERHDHRAHGVADLERALAADEQRDAAILAGLQCLGHDVDAVHAAHAAAVVDLERVVVVERQRLGRAARDHVVDRVLAAMALDVRLDFLLVDLHVVAPGADHGEVGALDGVHAVVRAARDLELELVGQRRAVHVVDEVVDQRAVDAVLVGARLLAARRADARHGGAHAGAGAAQVETVLVDLVEEMLRVLGGRADEHDVAGLAVERDQPRTPLVPRVRKLAQDLGRVMVAGRRLHAQRVEFLRLREHACDLGKARNDAAAIAEHRDGAAFPVAQARLVRMLELAEQIDHHVVVVREALQPGDEARPRSAFELVEHRRRMKRLGRFPVGRNVRAVTLGILGRLLQVRHGFLLEATQLDNDSVAMRHRAASQVIGDTPAATPPSLWGYTGPNAPTKATVFQWFGCTRRRLGGRPGVSPCAAPAFAPTPRCGTFWSLPSNPDFVR